MSGAVVHSRRIGADEDVAPVLADLEAALGGLDSRISAGDHVVIKPNFVAPFPAATTDLEVIAWVADRVREAGATPLVVESSGYEFDAESTFKVLGVRPFLAERDVEFANLDEGPFATVGLPGTGLSVEVASSALHADLVVNLPVLKGHTITKVTGAVKNLFGLLSRDCRRRLHVAGLDAAIAGLPRALPRAVHMTDARNLLVRAVFSDVRPLGFFLASDDPFASDHFGSRLLGIDPGSVAHLSQAADYDVSGAMPEDEDLSRRDSVRERAHRAAYSAFYLVDEVKARTVGGRSILPDLHWSLGVHPELGSLSDAELARLADACPVGAIDIRARRIDAAKCMPVRCMECLRIATEPGAVRLRGLNPPRSSGDD